jgi:hypothetical protein
MLACRYNFWIGLVGYTRTVLEENDTLRTRLYVVQLCSLSMTFECLQIPLNTISKELGAMTQGEVAGLCILIPPIPDPKHYYSQSRS